MFSEQQKDEIVAMYEGGVTIGGICLEVSPVDADGNKRTIYPQQVYSVLDERDILKRRGKGKRGSSPPLIDRMYTDKTKRLILDLYEQGRDSAGRSLTAKAIAKKLSISHAHVLLILKQSRIAVLPGSTRRTWKHTRLNVMKLMKDPSKSIEDIAAETGLGFNAILKIVSQDPDARRAKEVSKLQGRMEAVIEEAVRQIKAELATQGALRGVGGEVQSIQLQMEFPPTYPG